MKKIIEDEEERYEATPAAIACAAALVGMFIGFLVLFVIRIAQNV